MIRNDVHDIEVSNYSDNEAIDKLSTFETSNDKNTITSESYSLLFVFSIFTTILFSLTSLLLYISATSSTEKSEIVSLLTSFESTQTKPNIIFILADDLGWNSLGKAYDNDLITTLTTNLTSIANTGIFFSNFYAQEVCTPSRAALLTGKYPLSIGMQYGMISDSENWGLSLDNTLLGQVLQNEGYDTYMLGKCINLLLCTMQHSSPD